MTVAVYDLNRLPITFDIMCFVASVGAVEPRPKFVILADRRRVKTEKDKGLSDGQWMQRIHRVIVPSCWLLPGCRGVEVITETEEADKWRKADVLRPDTMMRTCVDHHRAGNKVTILEASQGAREEVAKFEGPLCVIQMRQSLVQEHKNSTPGAWSIAAGHMHKAGWNVVVVPDTDQVLANAAYPRWITHYPAASIDVSLRCALYEQADLVMSMGVGPAYFCTLSPSRYVAFVQHGTVGFNRQEKQFEKIWGIKWGEQLPFATAGQTIEYRRDDAEAICAAFDRATA